jgi:hypothetical protein
MRLDNDFLVQLRLWTYNKIVSNPRLYGGDEGTAHIMVAYLKEMYPNERVEQLPFTVAKALNSVSRFKNKILETDPTLDFRVINARRKRVKKYRPIYD